MGDIRVRLTITGRVQGVWFRDSTRRKAIQLGIFGQVKNQADGSVGILAEGPRDRIEALIAWCHEGPPHARVDGVEQLREEWQGDFDSFDIVF